MKIHKLFEIAEVVRSDKGSSPPPLPMFEHLAFHQCPSYNMAITNGGWPWGALIFDAATRYWADAGLWKSRDDVDVVELNRGDGNWTCFEDLYLETSYNSWYPAPEYRQSWRQTLNDAVAHPSSSLDEHSSSHPSSARGDGPSLSERCRTGGLRMHLLQRSTGSSLRTFTNLDQVRALLQNFTSASVPVVTVNDTTPLSTQVDAFQAFDVLVTPHGSQIGNMIFSDPNTTSIIEIIPVVRDIAFYRNAVEADFASYIVSTGHTPAPILDRPDTHNMNQICDDGQLLMEEHCQYDKQVEMWKCPPKWNKLLVHCDTLVDVSILEQHLKQAVSDLCKR
jgi:hypothetical protein